ncbi:MAG: VCBS repeat-containing protein [Planctomycetes bacterium]|nr:VCBS repeat-containing protein [Planctomycetota bacterium]
MTVSPTPSAASKSPVVMGLIVLLVLVAVGVGVYLTRDLQRSASKQASLDCEKWTTALNEALGLLENAPGNRLADAESRLQELARQFPKEPAAVRNLAICKFLSVDPALASPDSPPVDPSTALPAIEAAMALEPASPIPHILAAKIALFKQDAVRALREYQAATRLAPDDSAIWYEIELLASGPVDEETRAQARDAVASAVRADPTNTFLLKLQLLSQAREKQPAILDTLQSLRKNIEPILPSIKQNVRVDFDDVARQLTESVKDEKWPKVEFAARLINNALTPEEWVRSDLRRLQRHPLSYIVTSFSADVCAGADGNTGPLEPRIDVRFEAQVGAQALPELPAVNALNLSDMNQDSLLDVVALVAGEVVVFSRAEATTPWAKAFSAKVREPMQGLLVADLDRDLIVKARPTPDPKATAPKDRDTAVVKPLCQAADADVIVFGPAGVQVWRNDLADDGGRELVLVEQSAEFDGLRDVLAGVLADVDHDGDLDLVLSTKAGVSLWGNVGGLKFTEITSRSALPQADLGATSLVAVDWDRDLDIDVLISGPGGQTAGWLENMRHGSLRWHEFEPQLNKLAGSTGLSVLEADAHPSWDCVGAGPSGLWIARTTTEPGGPVKSREISQISATGVARTVVGDVDNDTYPDLLAWGEAGLQLYWGLPGARFEQASILQESQPLQAVAVADLDGDGDLDLVIAQKDRLVVLDNVGGNLNHWLAVRAKGDAGDNKNQADVNELGIGSLLELKAGRRYQAQVVTGQVTHFGLGKNTSADVLRAIWTSGVSQATPLPKGQVALCREYVIGTSCPYFYTWNGTRFEFCTDACWAAPLGLQLAEGVFAQPRAWEYLTIPPGKLVPKNGQYLIQMTEELWEATYLDRMELLVVDHPADVEIFSNEKVGPPDMAAFQVHTVRNRQVPIAARDKHGRDVLNDVIQEDGVFMKGFDAEPRHGVTDEHFLELDLGPLNKPGKITLFLTGWLYPASTSLRVGLSQDQSIAPLRPPALEVPDESGQWQVVRPFMGFPGGRTKTIAVDLTGLFREGDYRLRIATNLEFLWDAAFFTVDEEPVPVQITRLSVTSADLHYRGFSKIVPRLGFAPDDYDYHSVSVAPKWAPMGGLFTRYGDVTELLQADDDEQVVFGSGDELTVSFQVPEQGPPPGWKRDFLLHNVGWDKDNDLNVVTSQVVEPLPFQAMSGYPYRADEEYPDTDRHRAYLRKYQTRRQNPIPFWRQTQRSGANP